MVDAAACPPSPVGGVADPLASRLRRVDQVGRAGQEPAPLSEPVTNARALKATAPKVAIELGVAETVPEELPRQGPQLSTVSVADQGLRREADPIPGELRAPAQL